MPVNGTSPYPWPWDGDLDPRRLALVVTGAQPSLVGQTVGATPALESSGRAAAAVRSAGGLVAWVRHDPPPGRIRHGSLWAGSSIDGLSPDPFPARDPVDVVVTAAGIDGFHGSALDGELRTAGCRLVLLAGLGLETTVHSTMRSANDRGYECLLLSDAVAPHDPLLTMAALSSVCMSGGIFGAVGTTAELIDALRAVDVPSHL